jgi:hypothetical protein
VSNNISGSSTRRAVETAVEMLDPDLILALAEDMGMSRRRRVHHADLGIDSLILSALEISTNIEGRWLDAQRTCCPSIRLTATNIVAEGRMSSFLRRRLARRAN